MDTSVLQPTGANHKGHELECVAHPNYFYEKQRLNYFDRDTYSYDNEEDNYDPNVLLFNKGKGKSKGKGGFKGFCYNCGK